MVKVYTVAFEGIEARLIEVQCSVTSGLPGFSIVGLPDKTVSEAKDRIRASFQSMSFALPSKKIIVNLSPADLPKEGAHFDLPIALSLLGAAGILPLDNLEEALSLGELALDGRVMPVGGVLSAALTAAEEGLFLLCPKQCAKEAAWVGAAKVLPVSSLGSILRHYNGQSVISSAQAIDDRIIPDSKPASLRSGRDFMDVKGQERAKRVLEIAAAGRHHLFMMGEPGAGKSMLASRLPDIMPALTPIEALETSRIHSVAGNITEDGILYKRPFRDPHHTTSTIALIGGGRHALPGEISLAHNGVLFLDELPEFPRSVLETLRQPLEMGEVMIARANAHIRYPSRFLLVAAANPCRCGFLSNPKQACHKAPRCSQDYLGRISGPLIDRFDLRINIPAVHFNELENPPTGESSATISMRVEKARSIQKERFSKHPNIRLNADAEGAVLDQIAELDSEGKQLIQKADARFGLSARGYHRILKVSRTIADLEGSSDIRPPHVAEAISYRLPVNTHTD